MGPDTTTRTAQMIKMANAIKANRQPPILEVTPKPIIESSPSLVDALTTIAETQQATLEVIRGLVEQISKQKPATPPTITFPKTKAPIVNVPEIKIPKPPSPTVIVNEERTPPPVKATITHADGSISTVEFD